MPHVFDHTPTAQEVFDAACAFFATSPGPSTGETVRLGRLAPDCLYRSANGRTCVAGHFLPDEVYLPAMDDPDKFSDGSDVNALVRHYGDRVPAWWAGHKALLRELQIIHDAENNWFEDGWHAGQLAGALRRLASDEGLKPDAVQQVAIRNWTSVEA